MEQATAVVLDSDQTERDDIRNRLAHCGVLPICFKDEWICLENIHHIQPFFAVLRADSRESASRFVNVARAIKNNFPVIVLSNKREVENFIHENWLVNLFHLRYPADDKEFQGAIALLSAAREDHDLPVLIAGSPDRRKLIQDLPLLGLSKEPILIQGAPGVGKRLMAKAIHRCSAAKNGSIDFIDAEKLSGSWNQATTGWPGSVADGAINDHFSVIENIENLHFSLQSQLLSVLEEFNANGIGGKKHTVSAPFITLAGSDLGLLAEKGAFRKDLYHRLSVLTVTVPPLRGHSADICALAEYFTAQYSIRFNGGISRLPEAVLEAFVEYHWPGNVSELKHAIRQVLASGKTNWDHTPPLTASGGEKNRVKRSSHCFIDTDEIHQFLEKNREISLRQAKNRYVSQVEKKILKAALAQTNGNCKKAAGLLNISYKSVLNKVKAYQLV
ncbi:MAG: sigma 54-interacting transcriptional regulator [Desulfobacteraceae bacterium]|nr:sigma 54-interacting transcriptional regulator [Desulfobacteraceae bacterium]